MTNTDLLRAKMDQSGYKLRFIASSIGLTYQGLLKKLKNESEFKASEIRALCKMLKISEAERESIFFS